VTVLYVPYSLDKNTGSTWGGDSARLLPCPVQGLRLTAVGQNRWVLSSEYGTYKTVYLKARALTGSHLRPVGCQRGGNSNFHGARPVYLNFLDIKRIRASRLSIKNSLSGTNLRPVGSRAGADDRAHPDAQNPDIRARDVTNCSLLACFQGNSPIIDLGTVVRGLMCGGTNLRPVSSRAGADHRAHPDAYLVQGLGFRI